MRRGLTRRWWRASPPCARPGWSCRCRNANPKNNDRTPDAPVHDDTAEVAALRRRMEDPETQLRYRQRARRIAWTNAGYRNRDWRKGLLRGRDKLRAVAGWQATAHNLRCILRAEALASVFGRPVYRPADHHRLSVRWMVLPDAAASSADKCPAMPAARHRRRIPCLFLPSGDKSRSEDRQRGILHGLRAPALLVFCD